MKSWAGVNVSLDEKGDELAHGRRRKGGGENNETNHTMSRLSSCLSEADIRLKRTSARKVCAPLK
jgi:hypothetical protein